MRVDKDQLGLILRLFDDRTIRPHIEITNRVRSEIIVLQTASATVLDFECALTALEVASLIFEPWPYVRAVVFRRIADRIEHNLYGHLDTPIDR